MLFLFPPGSHNPLNRIKEYDFDPVLRIKTLPVITIHNVLATKYCRNIRCLGNLMLYQCVDIQMNLLWTRSIIHVVIVKCAGESLTEPVLISISVKTKGHVVWRAGDCRRWFREEEPAVRIVCTFVRRHKLGDKERVIVRHCTSHPYSVKSDLNTLDPSVYL